MPGTLFVRAGFAAVSLFWLRKAFFRKLLFILGPSSGTSFVEFSNDGLRVASMACLTLSVIFGVATLALIPLVQEARRPGQSNAAARG